MLVCKMMNDRFMLLGSFALSFAALAMALVGQIVFGLDPCTMCIYQRAPYVLQMLLSGAGLAMPSLSRWCVGLSGISYAVNAGLGAYHTGIEQSWWDETEGCAVSFDFSDPSAQSLLQQLTSAQASSCTEIPWQDPVLGLSMANYNAVLCFAVALFIAAYMACIHLHKKPSA